MQLGNQLQLVDDPRRNPEIPLKIVIGAVLCMPLCAARSLLSLDRAAREVIFKGWFRSKRKMVVSDTTIQRVLPKIDLDQTEQFLIAVARSGAEEHDLLRAALVPGGRNYRIGIFDGTCMNNGQYLEVLNLHGVVDAPVRVMATDGRGYELTTAKASLGFLQRELGFMMPDIFMGDALYFNLPFAHAIHQIGKDFLFKTSSDSSWRTVLSDTEFTMKAETRPNVVQTLSGFDTERQCSWEGKLSKAVYGDIPVLVAHFTENYSKDPRRAPASFWVITSALLLSPEEIREAAHVRWSIENNVFKRLNHLTGTKRFRSANTTTFINLVRFLCASLLTLDSYRFIIQRATDRAHHFFHGMKPTWLNFVGCIAQRIRLLVE